MQEEHRKNDHKLNLGYIRQKYLQQDLDESKALVNKRDNQIRDLCRELQEVFLKSIVKGNLIEVNVSNFFEDKAFEPPLK